MKVCIRDDTEAKCTQLLIPRSIVLESTCIFLIWQKVNRLVAFWYNTSKMLSFLSRVMYLANTDSTSTPLLYLIIPFSLGVASIHCLRYTNERDIILFVDMIPSTNDEDSRDPSSRLCCKRWTYYTMTCETHISSARTLLTSTYC